ncbi:MAG: 3-mercaptopyruvate sulfurtransferase [Hyphomicrobium sp.]
MQDMRKNWLVETDWLENHIHSPGLIILDGSWHLPDSGRNAKQEYLEEHIPNTIFFDIDDIIDETSPLPHMLPSQVKFASRMKKMGIGDGMRIIIYDTLGLFSAARVWWTFRVMGHKDVAVLNGGLRKWKAEGRPLEDGLPLKRTARHFTPLKDNDLVRDIEDMKRYVSKGGMQIVDARPSGRFLGRDPEPRPGLKMGHIPGSRNVPSSTILNTDGTLKSNDELQKIFLNVGIDPSKPVVTTCGSGITAAMLSFALALVGQTNAAVYDGSWAEWGLKDKGLPIETG